MGMFAQYGGYRHDDNELDIQHDVEVERDEQEHRRFNVHKITVTGKLHGDNPTLLTQRMNAMQQAYSVDGFNFGLFEDTGGATHHVLSQNGAIGGVMVTKGPSWSLTEGAEYTTYRTYTIELMARYLASDQNAISASEETVTIIGNGGPMYKWIQTEDIGPVRQRTLPSTVVRIFQQGTIVGLNGWPVRPPALFPQLLVNEAMTWSRRSPAIVRGSIYDFGLSYSYPMEAGVSIDAFPRIF